MTKKSKLPAKIEEKIAKDLVLNVKKDIKTVEDVGTSMMESGQQMILGIEMILKNQFNFTEDDLKKLEKELYHVMMVTKYVEDKDLSVMTHHTMEIVSHIAQKRLLKKLQSDPQAVFLLNGSIKRNKKGQAVIKQVKEKN